MAEVIVYSAPKCDKCDQLKTFLKSKGVEYSEINIREDMDSLTKIKSAGFRGLPVVNVNEDLMTAEQYKASIK